MIALADPRPDSDGLVEFRVDPTAQPGNVLPALARLLIDTARRNRKHTREEMMMWTRDPNRKHEGIKTWMPANDHDKDARGERRP